MKWLSLSDFQSRYFPNREIKTLMRQHISDNRFENISFAVQRVLIIAMEGFIRMPGQLLMSILIILFLFYGQNNAITDLANAVSFFAEHPEATNRLIGYASKVFVAFTVLAFLFDSAKSPARLYAEKALEQGVVFNTTTATS